LALILHNAVTIAQERLGAAAFTIESSTDARDLRSTAILSWMRFKLNPWDRRNVIISNVQRRAFFVASRLGTWLYRRFPLFGRLRGSIAIISRSGQYLVIERNDGRGWCFPGGLSRPGEAPEATMRREVLEETGLVVTSCRLLVGFDEAITHTQVFVVEAKGEVKGSWEGEPRWVSLSELSSNLYLAHRPVLTLLRKSI